MDFRRSPPTLPPITILNSTVSAVETFRFLGSTISQDLKWTSNTDKIIKKAQQRMYFLRQLRKFNLPQELLIQFYTATIQSVLCTSITVWFGSATSQDRNRLQRTVRTAEKIIGANLPSILWTCTCPESGNVQLRSLQIRHNLDMTCSNSSPLAGGTEHCTPEQPDTGTVSFHRLSH